MPAEATGQRKGPSRCRKSLNPNPISQNVQQDTASTDAVSLILKQAGRTAEEVAALSTLDDADRAAEGQFSGEAPTLTSSVRHGQRF